MSTLALAGPTASGKSSLALRLAEALGGEIVSCDSVAVYRGFDIGAAKPSADDQRRVRHHLVDIADWNESFDAAHFGRLAKAAIEDILGRGKTPIVCGGTGLYLRALRYGLVDAPVRDDALREELRQREESTPGSLYQELRQCDPQTASNIEPNNTVYVIRALEIFRLTGKPASVLRAEHGFKREIVPLKLVALRWPMPVLRERIAARVQEMLSQGLVDEVRRHLSAGVSPGCAPMRAVGYRQTVEMLSGVLPAASLAETITKATNAYAKRQMTWLRREHNIEWMDIAEDAELDGAFARLCSELAGMPQEKSTKTTPS